MSHFYHGLNALLTINPRWISVITCDYFIRNEIITSCSYGGRETTLRLNLAKTI